MGHKGQLSAVPTEATGGHESLELQRHELAMNPGPRQEQLPRLTSQRASFPVFVFYVHMCVDVSTCHMCGVMCRVTSGRGEQKALSPLTLAVTVLQPRSSDRLGQWEE